MDEKALQIRTAYLRAVKAELCILCALYFALTFIGSWLDARLASIPVALMLVYWFSPVRQRWLGRQVKKVYQCAQELLNGCDPLSAAALYASLSPRGRRGRRSNWFYLMELCMRSFCDDPALILERLQKDVKASKFPGLWKLQYYAAIGECYFQLGDCQGLKELRAKMEACLPELRSLQKAPVIQSLFTLNAQKTAILEKDWGFARFISEKRLTPDAPKLVQVRERYKLGLIALGQQNLREAHRHLQFVIENGGTLSVTETAGRLLEQYSQTTGQGGTGE